ncbi:L,D-transpeptidase, partial [Mycobacterium kansasii]
PYMGYYDWTKPSQSKPYPDVNMYPNLSIEVDIAKQRVYIKNGSTNLYTMYASTGIDNSTPRGHFAIQTERGYSFYNANEGMGARYWT